MCFQMFNPSLALLFALLLPLLAFSRGSWLALALVFKFLIHGSRPINNRPTSLGFKFSSDLLYNLSPNPFGGHDSEFSPVHGGTADLARMVRTLGMMRVMRGRSCERNGYRGSHTSFHQ
ncbi:hypothetical protein B0H17DRAFT_1143590 [Mycena rosella]|uniref:Uncharacterized protein n=1 Tax=Mycena rosella TaxID=1033263 RepID=A0AAD7CVQ9_MYCRO|nr:hypothetical protein B0H17DRAFT_1143590 [Mycena rosella]